MLNLFKSKDAFKQDSVVNKGVVIAPFEFEVEEKSLKELTMRQYDSLYNRFENACEIFQDAAADVENVFSGPSSYIERVNVLKTACKKFDRCFDLVSPYWYQDYYFMEMLQLENPHNWILDQNVVDLKKQYPISNMYDGYNWSNINFLRFLLKEYEKNSKQLKSDLEKEINLQNDTLL